MYNKNIIIMTNHRRSTVLIFFLLLNVIIINEMKTVAAFVFEAKVSFLKTKPMRHQRKPLSDTNTILHLQSIPPHGSTVSVLSFKNSDDDENVNNEPKVVDVNVNVIQQRKMKKKRVVSSTPIHNLVSVDTIEEYKEFMDEHKTDLVVIRFYAPWCKVGFFFLSCVFIFYQSIRLVI